MNEVCRVCGVELKGNRRRWIFSVRAPVNLRVVLSHVLGYRMTRGEGSEFLCGKCASALERVQRFDSVIARVQALSLERVHRLLTEKRQLASCLSRLHGQPPEMAGGQEEAEGDYAALLRNDMRLAGYECWSEGSEGGWSPCTNRNCAGCSALRVSDYEYDAVCRVPRRLASALASGRLSRSKSSSGQLDRTSSSLSSWAINPGSAPRSLSTSSLRTRSDSEAGSEDLPFDNLAWSSPSPDQTLAALTQQLEGVAYRPIRILPHSRIPVLVRGRTGGKVSSWGTARRRVSTGSDEESIPGISDEYRPLNLQKLLHLQNNQSRGQWREEQEEARTSEGEMEGISSTEKEAGTQQAVIRGLREYTGHRLIQSLARELHSKEQLLQESIRLVEQLAAGDESAAGPEADAIRNLSLQLGKRLEEPEQVSAEKLGVLEEMESEVQRLRQALREKDRDVQCLGGVLAHNEEMINMLNLSLGQKDAQARQLHQRMEGARQEWEEQQDLAVRRQDGIISQQQEALQSLARDVEALSDTLLVQGLGEGPDSPGGLCLRLRDKERLLTELNRQRADQERVIVEISRSLAEKDQMIQDFSIRDGQTRDVHAQELHCVSQELSARDREVCRLGELQACATREHLSELLCLQALVDSKDQLILALLEDGRGRDRILSDLQEQLRAQAASTVYIKQTL
ncbi:flagellar attachment zone protein 1 isoform X2 [Narcine bancroftii]|uniref:flagellar attachment zone protein 1 isoform X2 n=1 Tax=Narcine bancroftii TaxID=1343680 RepID=UPI00383136D9